MQEKLVSVIVPTYNGEKHLAATLDSIINQDYKNLEIIFVNDASTDNTLNIAENVLKNSGRIYKIVNHEKNCGLATTRNTGLKFAAGKYVWFCDSDDWADKSFISSLYVEAEEKNVDLVFCGMKDFYEEDNKLKFSFVNLKCESLSPEYYLRAWARGQIPLWSVCNVMFNKDFLIKNNLRFFEICRNYEDIEFIFKAISLSSRISLSLINKGLYIYVHRVSHKTQDYVVARDYYKNFWQQIICSWRAGRCILKHTKDKIIRNYVLSYFIADMLLKYCKLTAKAGDYGYYNKIIKNLKHKKIRQIMLGTFKFIFREPELFFKSLMLLYAPNLYYKIRSKKAK